jgi:hypothetical protein
MASVWAAGIGHHFRLAVAPAEAPIALASTSSVAVTRLAWISPEISPPAPPFKIDFAGSMGVHYEVILKWRARRSRGFCLVDGIGVLVAKVSTVDTVDNPVEELGPGSGKS